MERATLLHPEEPPDLELISFADAKADMVQLVKRRKLLKMYKVNQHNPSSVTQNPKETNSRSSSAQFKRPAIRSNIDVSQSSAEVAVRVEGFESKLLQLKALTKFIPFPAPQTSKPNTASKPAVQNSQKVARSIDNSIRNPTEDPVLSKLRPVKQSYSSVQEYYETFSPLCMEEAVEQVIRSSEVSGSEGMAHVPWPVVETAKTGMASNPSSNHPALGQSLVSASLKFHIGVNEHASASSASTEVKQAQRSHRTFLSKAEGAHLRTAQAKQKAQLKGTGAPPMRLRGLSQVNMGDLLVIGPFRDLAFSQKDLFRSTMQSCFALVTNSARVSTSRSTGLDSNRDEVHKVRIFAEIRVQVLSRDWECLLKAWSAKRKDSRNTPIQPRLSAWSLTNLITSWREHEGICAAASSPQFPLRRALVSGRNEEEPKQNQSRGEVPGVTLRYRKWLQEKYNESQMEAILSAATRTRGFTLVQGPPGTGKTTTLLGIINTLHLSVMQRFYASALPSLDSFEVSNYKSEREWDEERMLKKPHMLVSAPSNTAVDGVLKQVRSMGLMDGVGNTYRPAIVRVGSGSKDPAIRDTLLEHQVDELIKNYAKASQHMNRDNVRRDIDFHRGDLRENMVRLREVVKNFQTLARLMEDEADLAKERQEFEKQYHDLAHKVTSARNHLIHKRRMLEHIDILSSNNNSNKVRTKLRQLVLERAEIVFATLSGGALRSVINLGSKFKFKVVVVDEAGQAVEPSILVPLQHGAEHCVLVGDPQQLPATVTSDNAKKFKYQQSLFERLQVNNMQTHLLNTQYRCHPVISQFTSTQFYKGKLQNGENVLRESYRLPLFDHPAFGPMVFYNLPHGVASQHQAGGQGSSTGSWGNVVEAQAVVNMYRALRRLQQTIMGPHSPKWGIGVITPYSKQLALIRALITKEFGPQELQDGTLDTNTVDGYQGREFDIIIVSCVRADDKSSDSNSIGFLDDARRLNVAISRAKFALLVIGQQEALKVSRLWRNFMQYCKKRGKTFNLSSSSCTTEGILSLK